jgi:hypothetical protein
VGDKAERMPKRSQKGLRMTKIALNQAAHASVTSKKSPISSNNWQTLEKGGSSQD